MQITINGITKDCTEWGCENRGECEYGCVEFAPEYPDPDLYQHELAERDAGAK